MSHLIKPTDMGTNRTGLAMSPIDGAELVEAAERHALGVVPDGQAITAARLTIARESRPVGTMPPPMSLKGMVKTVLARMKGESTSVLLDKLGERLVFERGGVRLYEALAVKLQASDTHDPSLSLVALQQIQQDELAHVALVVRAIKKLGGDPTALTPCADVAGVMTLGFVQVLSDPRTTLTQCLNAMLAVELGDGAGWELLIRLAEQLGQTQLAEEFKQAELTELGHAEQVQLWLSTAVLGQADRELDVARLPVTPA